MKNKKKVFIIFTLTIIIIIAIFALCKFEIVGKENEMVEYTPQEEISDEQMRATKLTLYFLNSETEEIKSEGRQINSIELLENPYKKIVELLIQGPESTQLLNVFPDNTKILDAKLENHLVILNFSEEIINYKDDVQKYNIINSVLNSLTELNEVDGIKILVNNETNEKFDENYTAIY